MKDTELIKKFRPIFIFSQGERYYPVSKKFIRDNSADKKNWSLETKSFKNLSFPDEPLYYNIVEKDENFLIVSYILIFPYTRRGIFGITSETEHVKAVLVYIDKKINTLKQIVYEEGVSSTFKLKTTRPTIYVEKDTHIFSSSMPEKNRGLRWEPLKVSKFITKDVEDVTIKNKPLSFQIDYVNIKNE